MNFPYERMQNKIQAILLAGGLGTRLRPVTETVPKALVPVAGRPMVYFVLEQLKKHGITTVAIAISYLGEMLQEELGDGSQIGMKITYLVEPEPMGTGGWSQLVDWDALDDHFLVLNADNLFWIDVDAFLRRHTGEGAAATIAAIQIPTTSHAAYEVLVPDEAKQRLTAYVDRDKSTPHIEGNDHVFVSSGWYVMTPQIKELIPKKNPISNEVDIWPLLSGSDHTLGLYHATEPWFDSGTPERIARIEAFLDENEV